MKFSLEKTWHKRNRYNAKSNAKFGWSKSIPWAALGFDFEEFTHNEGYELETLQDAVNVEADGLIGMGTLVAIAEWAEERNLVWNPISGDLSERTSETQFFLWNSLSVPIECKYAIIPPSDGYDLHPFGSFSTRSRVIDSVILHWGGLDPAHLYRIFSNRSASSHFGIGVLKGTTKPCIVQYLDTAHIAWHSKGANETSIGIDICQQPEIKWLGHFVKLGYDVKVIPNPYAEEGLGPDKVLSLDSRIKDAAISFLYSLPKSLGLKSGLHPDPLRLSEFEPGILCHSNVDFKGQGKWDIAPWWDELRDGVAGVFPNDRNGNEEPIC